jgi:Flp pilus assembly pilin Flp
MKKLLKTFLRDEDGAALVEYGIALLVVILVGTGALIGLAGDTQTLFEGAEDATEAAVTAAGGTGTGGTGGTGTGGTGTGGTGTGG